MVYGDNEPSAARSGAIFVLSALHFSEGKEAFGVVPTVCQRVSDDMKGRNISLKGSGGGIR